jgi:deaminated glutathione amidase
MARSLRDTSRMRVAMAQISASDDPEANRKLVAEYVAQAAEGGAAVVVFPEWTMLRTASLSEYALASVAEPLDGPFVSALSELAQRHEVFVVAGMTERVEGEPERAGNTIVAVDDRGSLVGSYRKTHMCDAWGTVESAATVPGDGSTLVFPVGDHRLGIGTCYDLRFPELGRVLVDRGADVLLYPSGWLAGYPREDHWRVLLRARAIENVSWVVGVSQAEGRHLGRSMAIDPVGIVVAGLSEEPGLGFVDVSAERTASARHRNPALENRRFGVHLLPP